MQPRPRPCHCTNARSAASSQAQRAASASRSGLRLRASAEHLARARHAVRPRGPRRIAQARDLRPCGCRLGHGRDLQGRGSPRRPDGRGPGRMAGWGAARSATWVWGRHVQVLLRRGLSWRTAAEDYRGAWGISGGLLTRSGRGDIVDRVGPCARRAVWSRLETFWTASRGAGGEFVGWARSAAADGR